MDNPICFVADKKPISYNSPKKGKYQAELQNAFKRFQDLYPDLPINGKELSSKVVYIHKDDKGIPDVDNLSKPFIDAFSEVIY